MNVHLRSLGSTTLPPARQQPTPTLPSADADPIDTYQGQAGSVVVVGGDFSHNDQSESHAAVVVRTLRSSGFPGNVYQVQNIPTRPQAEGGPGLTDPNNTPEQSRQAIELSSWRRAVYSLDGYTAALDKVDQKGLKNSAVNISSGVNKADLMLGVISQGMKDPAAYNNLLKAYDLDPSRMDSSDPAIASAERNKLQKGILSSVNHAIDGNPEVAQARARYQAAVDKVEAGHNSVVVSVGNTGELPAKLAQRGQIDLPADFQDSLNINASTTAVGESVTQNGITRPSPSSAPEHHPIVFADGTGANNPSISPQPQTGTSFAAPRVAAVMATLHKQNPVLSSQQIETLMRNQLTTPSGQDSQLDLTLH